MDTLVFLGRTLGFSVAAGVNLYATIALIGLASRFGWVALPPEYAIFDSDWVIGAALLLYAVEFIADKVPWVDTLWDTVHTFIRPLGGAAVAVASLGDASPGMTALVALIGRHRGGGGPRDEGRHPGHRQHQSRTVLQLDRQPRRRRVRASRSAFSR